MSEQPSFTEACWFCFAMVVLLAVLLLDATWQPGMDAERLEFVEFLGGAIGLSLIAGLIAARARG